MIERLNERDHRGAQPQTELTSNWGEQLEQLDLLLLLHHLYLELAEEDVRSNVTARVAEELFEQRLQYCRLCRRRKLLFLRRTTWQAQVRRVLNNRNVS